MIVSGTFSVRKYTDDVRSNQKTSRRTRAKNRVFSRIGLHEPPYQKKRQKKRVKGEEDMATPSSPTTNGSGDTSQCPIDIIPDTNVVPLPSNLSENERELHAELAAIIQHCNSQPQQNAEEGRRRGEAVDHRPSSMDIRAWLLRADEAIFRCVAPATQETPRHAGDDAGGPLTTWGQTAMLRVMETVVQNRSVFVIPIVDWLKGRAIPAIVDYVGPPTPERDLIFALLSSFMNLCLDTENGVGASTSVAIEEPTSKRARRDE